MNLIEEIERARVSSRHELLERVVNILRNSNERYSWVGVYVIQGNSLILEAFSGEQTEHRKLGIGEGICGLAAKLGETVVVPDVRMEPRYIACFPSTKSEIVVPIKVEGRVVGEIDIDSDLLDAFGPEDINLLERVAKVLVERPEFFSDLGD
ncbi:MAG: GAF domain-containing protein [Candidatus Bathyarchaeia archaeon]